MCASGDLLDYKVPIGVVEKISMALITQQRERLSPCIPASRSKTPMVPTPSTGTMLTLALLDKRTVAVQLDMNGRSIQVAGVASYGEHADLGTCLTISCDDEASEFEIVLREDEWTGRILPGGSSGCDFLIPLHAGSFLAN